MQRLPARLSADVGNKEISDHHAARRCGEGG